MNLKKLIPALVLVTAVTLAAADEWTLEDMVSKDDEGRIIAHPKPIDKKFKNPWPDKLEEEFRDRVSDLIEKDAADGVQGGNTHFENEKRMYGHLMTEVLGGHAEEAMKRLQGEDAQAKSWHKKTEGIDYYACFTIKQQTRKYFYFGDLLRPEYRKRMYKGAKTWTEKDPHRRPHHSYKGGGGGWTPETKNSWVDVRGTENLWLMRVTSVYLFAEETGNKEVAGKYKDHILTYAKLLYRVGMGEWDSENYHGHSLAPLHNLYDFARDDEVKMAAKAALDWLYTAGAVKYYRGGFNGPTKRDYNHAQPFGGSASAFMWTYFGDTAVQNPHVEGDAIHQITSNYRPPLAVMNLARKNFDRPAEIFACKGGYGWATSGQTGKPQFFETQYFGKTFQMGSLAGGTRPGGNDVNGWKVMAFSSERNVLDLQCAPTDSPKHVGSPQYNGSVIKTANRVAQNRNIAIWLAEKGDSPWTWVLPKIVDVETQQGVTFLKGEKTWFAIHPINISVPAADDKKTAAISEGKKAKWKEHKALSAKGKGGDYCGFAIEIGEGQSYDAFKKSVLSKSKLDASSRAKGVVSFSAADGKTVKMAYAKKLDDYGVWRDGKKHKWSEHAKYLYTDADEGADGLIYNKWMGGTLTVRAGGATFTCTVDDSGK
ncbi:MAG: hypothetical protein ACLFVU_14180, partial [Phycisphaerae bacterium]